MSAIEILGLEKTYAVGFWRKRPRQALKPLTLSIEEGETFGFLGPNGAGKTTTLKLLMGLIRPTSGQARILGMAIDDLRVKAQIGFLPEQPYFYDYLTARELLAYYAQLSDVPGKERTAKGSSNAGAGWAEGLRRCSAAKVFQGHVAEGWHCTSYSAQSQESCFSMNRCLAWIPWAVAKSGNSLSN